MSKTWSRVTVPSSGSGMADLLEDALGGRFRANEDLVGPRLELRVVEGNARGLESGLGEQAEPVRASEEPLDVPVELHAGRPDSLAEQVSVVDDIGRVFRVRVPRPLEIPQAPVRPVVPAVVG